MRQDHPLPDAFRRLRARYRGEALLGVGVVAYHQDGVGLVVHVTTWPVGGFSEPWLDRRETGPLFTPRGQAAWDVLRGLCDLAVDHVADAQGPALAALILHPDAREAAITRRAQLLERMAA